MTHQNINLALEKVNKYLLKADLSGKTLSDLSLKDLATIFQLVLNIQSSSFTIKHDASRPYEKGEFSFDAGQIWEAVATAPAGLYPRNDDGSVWTSATIGSGPSLTSSTGQIIIPISATFAGLSPVPSDASSDISYWTILTADDIGTGDVDNPQYPKGIYTSGANQGSGWMFAVGFGDNNIEILDEDDFASDDATKPPSQRSSKAYSDKHNNFLAAAGWQSANSGAITKGTGKELAYSGGEFIRVVNGVEESFVVPAQDPINLQYIGGDGVNIGSTVTDVDNLQYDPSDSGTLVNIGDESTADVNDAQAQQLFLDPSTGQFFMQYGTQRYSTTAAALYQYPQYERPSTSMLVNVLMAVYCIDEDSTTLTSATNGRLALVNSATAGGGEPVQLLPAWIDPDNADYSTFGQTSMEQILSVSKEQVIHVDDFTTANTTDVKSGQYIIVGKGGNYAGTWRNHSNETHTFVATNLNFTRISGQILSYGYNDLADATGLTFGGGAILNIAGSGTWRNTSTDGQEFNGVEDANYRIIADISAPEVNYGPLPIGDVVDTDTEYLAIAPENTANEVFGNTYIVKPHATPTPDPMTATFWDAMEVVGGYTYPANATRTINSNGTFGMPLDLKNSVDANTYHIPVNFTPSFQWIGVSDAAFVFNDYTNGLVEVVAQAPNQEIKITGSAWFVHTRDGNFHKVSVYPATSTPPLQVATNSFVGNIVTGNANNSNGPRVVGEFTPANTGLYEFKYWEVTNNNQVWASLGTEMANDDNDGHKDLHDGSLARIDNGAAAAKTQTVYVQLTAGVTYHISGWGGGGTAGTVGTLIRWALPE